MELASGVKISEVMTPDPVIVPPTAPVQQVVALMNERRIGAVLVGVGDQVQGIFTERDLLRFAGIAPPGWRQRPIADWMTRDPWTIGSDASWEQGLSTMETLHVRHLPVVDNEKVVGILSARGLMNTYNEYLNRAVEERTKELREAYERLQQRDAELQLHMAVAARLQKRLIPGKPPTLPDLDLVGHYEPLDPLGGDYYDFAKPDEQHVSILIADASGHSIPAAMVAFMARTAFTAVAPTTTRPDAILTGMNEYLYGLTGEHFVTAFCGVYDRQSRVFTYANAGHPYPLVFRRLSRGCESLTARGVMLGIMEESQYEVQHVQLNPHDQMLFYTDGVLDCRSETDETFGAERLEKFLSANGQQPANALVKGLADELTAYRGERPATDDMSILAAEVK